jgi:hypothetical protein
VGERMTPFEIRANALIKSLSDTLGPKHQLVHDTAAVLTLAYAEMDNE